MDAPLPPVPTLSSDDKIWAIASHLSLLFGVGFLVPLIIWLAKRDDAPAAAAHAREALNFHLSLYIYGLACAVLIFFCIGYFLLIGLAAFGVVCAIIAALKALRGELFHYPLTIPIFR
jgi:uncharacterized Tic20 family protein